MDNLRKPFQGVFNIIRFNWHFYVIAILAVFVLLFLNSFLNSSFHWIIYIISISIIFTTLISLLVSFYVYDLSGLYRFEQIEGNDEQQKIINVNAGFDETSVVFQKKFPNAELIVLDFYDPHLHTEVSIKRARKAYPPFPGTLVIKTNAIELPSEMADKIFLILSAHEIRDLEERVLFFGELNRILKPDGQIQVVEHLRDLPNLLAYNIGFFHFYSKKSWKTTFKNSNFKLLKEQKTSPFISTFTIIKNGNSF